MPPIPVILFPRPRRTAAIAAAALLAAAAALAAPRVDAAEPASRYPELPVLVDENPDPRVVEVTLTAAPLATSIIPGAPRAHGFGYNGGSPGPTLEVREGDRVVVRFRNRLPEATTVHWHGLHLPFAADGSPFHPVAPGDDYTYQFTVRPGSAGTYWYHPHPDHRTGHQVGMGLYGAVVVRADDDPLPRTLPEKVLIFSDNRVSPEGGLDFPPHQSPQATVDRENGREGDVLLVNGTVLPTMDIRAGEVQRWRIINASAARVLRLHLPGHTLLHVGSDGGLFERPVEVSELVVANAERVEVLVRGTGQPGARAVLQTLPYDRYIPQTRPADWNRTRDLLVLRYTAQPAAAPPALPALLRHVPALDTLQATARRTIVLSQGMINGQLMDMGRVDVSARLGATEVWEVENLVGMDHPFHLHGFQFQVLDRDGVPEPFRSWKDVVNVPKHQTARFIVRYENHAGKWMFHCHILDHEDHGMMGVLEVR